MDSTIHQIYLLNSLQDSELYLCSRVGGHAIVEIVIVKRHFPKSIHK